MIPVLLRLREVDDLRAEIDVTDAQREELAEPAPGEERRRRHAPREA
ncbi:MAG TPA: hypothetical protein VH062_07685 [Polyangiaceae bacterium]|nr:hypothetical protein [Polyangiaceae bacterium]